MECTHNFKVDNHNVGTCALCGEVRQFPLEKGGQVKVLRTGRRRRPGRPPKAAAPLREGLATSRNGHLPHFPDFSGTWDISVQLKWLDTYYKLSRKAKNGR